MIKVYNKKIQINNKSIILIQLLKKLFISLIFL